MLFEDVVQILDALDDSGVRHWFGGGWGVAVLVGRQTREYRDLDLAVNVDDLQTCLQTLSDLGYVIQSDWLPARIELRAPGNRWVDVHPVKLDDNGRGLQAGLDGAHVDYPPSAFTAGPLNGRRINCLSPQQQRDFHADREHQRKDTHDLVQLDAMDGSVKIPKRPEMPETITAGPITLARWTVDRADGLDQAINESLPELMPFMPWASAEHNLDDTTSYLVQSRSEWDSGENFGYAMLTPQDEVVGACSLMSRLGPDVFEIGYWVHSAHAGKGYATVAASALAEAGLGQPGIDRVEIHHDVDNVASGRVAEKAAFHEVGSLKARKRAPSDSGTHRVWVRRGPHPG